MFKYPWDNFIEEKMRLIASERSVLDMGGGERFQKWLAPYRGLFAKCDYKTMDYDPKTSPDVVGDIHAIPIKDMSIDAIICHSVLEHVENPILAAKEMHRILKTGGKLFLHVPSIYPYHARKGFYPDYWRFFDDTLRNILKDFTKVEIVKRGGYFKALFFFVPFQHKLRPIIDPLAAFLDWLFRTENRTTTSGYYVYAEK